MRVKERKYRVPRRVEIEGMGQQNLKDGQMKRMKAQIESRSQEVLAYCLTEAEKPKRRRWVTVFSVGKRFMWP